MDKQKDTSFTLIAKIENNLYHCQKFTDFDLVIDYTLNFVHLKSKLALKSKRATIYQNLFFPQIMPNNSFTDIIRIREYIFTFFAALYFSLLELNALFVLLT